MITPHHFYNSGGKRSYLKSELSLLFVLLTLSFSAQSQATFSAQRAEEDYSYLKDSTNLDGLDAIKFIALNRSKTTFLSLGGSISPRYERLSNQAWEGDNDEAFYTHRMTIHVDAHLGKFIRLFGELQHGYKTGGEAFLESDQIDVHQGFLELRDKSSKLSLRLGRQELKFGVGRLIDFGRGPNIRRTFDIGKLTFSQKNTHIEAYYGKDVRLGFEAFDNQFNLFKQDVPNSEVWGIYSQFSFLPNEGEEDNTELYYLGIDSPRAFFNDVAGRETRHTIGARRYGVAGQNFTYNTEFIYQFGQVGGSSISAFNLETDWKYSFNRKKWRPTFGLKLDWSSGDHTVGDGRINSFNPMYVNPSIYSFAVVNTPVNLLSVHPSFTVFPVKNMMIQTEFALFYRTSKVDGLYAPPNRQVRMAGGLSERHIGNVIGLFFLYNYNRYLSFNLRSSYFIAGNFIEASGASEPIFQFAPTATFTF